MLNFCGIVVAILKMATGRNFSMSLTLKNFYCSPFSKWPPIYRTNSTLSDFNDIWYVGRIWCPKLIPEIEKFLSVAIFKNFPIGFYSNPHHFWTPQNMTLTPFTTKLSSSSRDLPWTSSWSAERKEKENNNQHCPISTTFDMWVEYDVPNWFLRSKNFCQSPFSKSTPQYRTNSTLFD
jgi:hypothetical protein